MVRRLFNDYGMILVLAALCALFSLLTLKKQIPYGDAAVEQLVESVRDKCQMDDMIVVVGAAQRETGAIAAAAGEQLEEDGFHNVHVVVGTPRDLREELDKIAAEGQKLAAIATGGDVIKWRVIEQIPEDYPESADFKLLTLTTHLWPDFLKRSNLLAIVDRIVVIAVIAIGMTMVIITAGIDLSVGSLIALSAVIATLVMKQLGGLQAPAWVVLVGFVAGTCACGLVGAIGGAIVARFKVAPFITTLAVMMMARGLAFLITGGFSIYQVPPALPWLGQGRTAGMPNTVILLVVLYVGGTYIHVAHAYGTLHLRCGRQRGGGPPVGRSGRQRDRVRVCGQCLIGRLGWLYSSLPAQYRHTEHGCHVRAVRDRRGGGGRDESVGRLGTHPRHADRRLHHFRDSKRHESAGNGELHAAGGAGGRDPGRRVAGQGTHEPELGRAVPIVLFRESRRAASERKAFCPGQFDSPVTLDRMQPKLTGRPSRPLGGPAWQELEGKTWMIHVGWVELV